jgi:glycosyltransferase involved in cell wall biosynthesis
MGIALTPSKYKILYINKSSETGGAEASLFLLLKHLNKKTFEPVVVLPSEGILSAKIRELGLQVFIIPLNNIDLKSLNPWPYLATVWQLSKIIRREHIALIHANDVATNQYALIAAKLSRVPIVCHMRGLNDKRTVKRGFLPWVDHLIANSQAVAQTYLSCRKNPEKVSVIYNGVELKKFSKDDRSGMIFRKRFEIPENTFLVGIAGRIFAEKGHHILVHAISEIRKKHYNICVAIIGPISNVVNCKYQRDDNFLFDLRQMITKSGLEKYIFFIEEQRDMASVYNALDLLVLPSKAEPFGRVLIEAMAMGKPVVATKAGGVPEVVDDGVTGVLVPPGDMSRLVEAILSILTNQAIAREMGIAGRKRAEALFSIETNVSKTEKVYLEILNQYHKLYKHDLCEKSH